MNLFASILPSLAHLGIWGYWLVLVISFLESLVLVGEILPGAMLIVFAGFLSAQGFLDIGTLIWFTMIGAILGDNISYYFGAKGTKYFDDNNRWLKVSYLDSGKQFFYKHGGKSVLFARFAGPLRPIVPFVAGLSGLKRGEFVFWNTIGVFLWSTSHLLLGYFFGNAFTLVELWSIRLGYIAGIIIVFFIFIYIIRHLAVRYGRQVMRFIESVSSSIRRAVAANPDVQKLVKRHPRFFAFIKNRTTRKSFYGLPLTLIIIAFAYILSLFFGIVADVLASEAIVLTDIRVANLVAYFRNPELTKIFLWITLLGNWEVVVGSAIIVTLILWLWKKEDYIIYLWIALALGEIFTYLGKLLIHRIRPLNAVYIENSFSFPSGHAMIAIIFYGFLTYMLIRQARNWKYKANFFFAGFLVILAVGFSRLYLGVHYVSDVWGGYLLGFLILATVTTIYEWKQWEKGEVDKERVVITKRIEIATAGLILANIFFYVGFAMQYHPPLTSPITDSIQDIGGDIGAYFTEHNISKYSEMLNGSSQEPLGFIFLAKDDEALKFAFLKAGWSLADRVSIESIAKIAKAALLKTQYLSGPMTPSFWNATVNDFGFEKPTKANVVSERHHIRIWKTNLRQDGLTIYVGTASLDMGIKWLVTHRIDPDIDTERAFVKDSLQAINAIADMQEIQFVDPVLGKNYSNDVFFTNGKLYIIKLN